MDHQRAVEQARHHSSREGDIAAHAEHDVRTMQENRPSALPESDQQVERQQREPQDAAAANAGKAHPGHGISARRNEPAFHAASRAEPDDIPALCPQIFRHAERRKYMTAGSSRHDHDGAAHERFLALTL
ncbi:hypothetical protein D3C83_39870 [compost metagenome]